MPILLWRSQTLLISMISRFWTCPDPQNQLYWCLEKSGYFKQIKKHITITYHPPGRLMGSLWMYIAPVVPSLGPPLFCQPCLRRLSFLFSRIFQMIALSCEWLHFAFCGYRVAISLGGVRQIQCTLVSLFYYDSRGRSLLLHVSTSWTCIFCLSHKFQDAKYALKTWI